MHTHKYVCSYMYLCVSMSGAFMYIHSINNSENGFSLRKFLKLK